MKLRLTILLILSVITWRTCSTAGEPDKLPAPAKDFADTNRTATAVVAGGCFWCVEAVFEEVRGVTKVVSGYAGGQAVDADYDAVSAGRTKHAEVVEITYDPRQISYGKLLHIFMTTHHPTQKNRQGPDRGTQYRSAIFPADARQREIARAYLDQLTTAQVFSEPIATTVEPLDHFYPAEDYHQDYVARHPRHPYVLAWVPAKLAKLRNQFPDLVRAK